MAIESGPQLEASQGWMNSPGPSPVGKDCSESPPQLQAAASMPVVHITQGGSTATDKFLPG